VGAAVAAVVATAPVGAEDTTVAALVAGAVVAPAADVTEVPTGTRVGVGLGVDGLVGAGVEVISTLVAAVMVVGVVWATGVSPAGTPGFQMSTTPISSSPMKQNASRIINGMANLRFANISRNPCDILFLLVPFL
jgi:hypothetical protein